MKYLNVRSHKATAQQAVFTSCSAGPRGSGTQPRCGAGLLGCVLRPRFILEVSDQGDSPAMTPLLAFRVSLGTGGVLVTGQVGFLSLPAFEEMARKETHCSLTSALWPCLPGVFSRGEAGVAPDFRGISLSTEAVPEPARWLSGLGTG